MHRRHKILAAQFLLSVLLGCNQPTERYADPKLTPDSIVVAANAFLDEKDIEPDLYNIELLAFDYAGRKWQLRYEGTSGVIHDYYFVSVSDEDITNIEIRGR